MILKEGSIVSHSGALGWGSGKVLEVTDSKITIEFSDGISRKIAASHILALQPAAADTYLPPPEAPPVVKARRVPSKAKTKK